MAQKSPDAGSGGEPFLERLPGELTRWESEGIITAEQSQAIRARYAPSESAAKSQVAQGRLVTGLSIIGAVLVGLGIILFFASNWDGIDRWPKLVIILAAILGAHGLGYYLRYHRGYRRVGSAFVLLACIVYGAGVHLVGQVYNSDVNDPRLMLFWFVGVFPLVYIVRSQPVQFLGVVLFLLAVGFRLPDWTDEISLGEAVLGAALFLVLGLFVMAVGRVKQEIAALRPYSEVFELAGLITALGATFALTFKDIFDSFTDGLYIQGDIEWGFQAMIGAAGAATLVLVIATAWLHRKKERDFVLNSIEGIAIAVLLTPAFVVVGLDTRGEVFFAVVFNTLFAIVLLGVLVSGYMRGRETWVNIGLAFISIDIFARYFEYSWDLLDRSFIFVAAGAILLLGGYLVERGRQKMMSRIRAAEASR